MNSNTEPQSGCSKSRTIRLILQFDGTDFCGWQMQDAERTVQGVLSEALQRLIGCPKVTLHSSSRTDSGVHALAMPVHFRTESTLPLKAFVLGLNSLLPDDLRVLQAREMDPSFHARFCARSKTYRYRIQNGRVAWPIERRYAWNVRPPLRPEPMREAAASLVGRHDFSAFRAAYCDAASPVRTITACEVFEERAGLLVVRVTADGFLRNMVRILVGTLVQVGLAKRPPEWVAEVLAARDRRLAGPTAPPQGLFLERVEYAAPYDGPGPVDPTREFVA